MADRVPTEGLDYIVNVLLKNGGSPANLYLFLFKGGSASTVPGAAATIGTMGGGFSEINTTDYPGYARVAVAVADWGAIGDQTIWTATYRGAAASQKSFAAATSAGASAINGFGLASASTAGVAIYYSNFDDATAIPILALGDIVRVTPRFGLGDAA